ncbi:MAG: hypothetical protein JO022_01365, partial [Acidobacteriaceae bacterium]|nr:hypothetical protein [Acidobacteriaceae bacterium]
SPSGGPAEILVSIPGKIERRYHGVLRVTPLPSELLLLIETDREVAVGSIVAAEVIEQTPIEALKAQAVVARSFLAASEPRHKGFQFCDTTHCQFLRHWPPPDSAPYRAAEQTKDLVLTFHGSPFAPLYSAACGGRTRALTEPDPGSRGYLYRSVDCAYCLRHPQDPKRGHSIGMCQQGAAGMAAHGASYREILDHYYPGTSVTTLPVR